MSGAGFHVHGPHDHAVEHAGQKGHHDDGDAFFPTLDPHLWREVSRRPQPKSDTPEVDFDFVEFSLK